MIDWDDIAVKAKKLDILEKLELLADQNCGICKGRGWVAMKVVAVDSHGHFQLAENGVRSACICTAMVRFPVPQLKDPN